MASFCNTNEGLEEYIRKPAEKSTTQVFIPEQSQWRFRGIKKGYVTLQRGGKVLLMCKEERNALMRWYDEVDKERGSVWLTSSVMKKLIEPVSVKRDVVELEGVHNYCLHGKDLSFEETEIGLLITPKRRKKKS